MIITKEMEEEEKHLVEEGEKKEREMMEEVTRYMKNLIYIDNLEISGKFKNGSWKSLDI